MAALSEFDIIRRYFSRPTRHTLLAGGDDAALVQVSAGSELVVSADMLVAGRHFFPDADARKLGHKCLAVNLSDLAAMGATPRWATLALALPGANPQWLEEFAQGFYALAQVHDVDLIGGDTTQGPLNICVQIMGEVPAGQALRRDGAKPGDDIWVSGTLGDAALALAQRFGQITLSPAQAAACISKLEQPAPRVALGIALRGLAHSAIDISDGFAADLTHILERSRLGAQVNFANLPVSEVVRAQLSEASARQAVAAGGDDYELCFTAPVAQRAQIEAIGAALSVKLTRVGSILAAGGLRLLDADGTPMQLARAGFEHFA